MENRQQSFPTRERGLKYVDGVGFGCTMAVVPHAGTWIEIRVNMDYLGAGMVVPHAGTWIEIKIR